MTLLAVTGLNREAQIVGAPQVLTVAGGGDALRLPGRIDAAITPQVLGVISIGIAGALDPSLKVGDVVIATDVVSGQDVWTTDEGWRLRLQAALPKAKQGVFWGSDHMIVSAAAKAALFGDALALCVDMESHIAAAAARRHHLPLAAVRFISDDARRALPHAAQVGLKPDGDMDLAAVLKSLASDPQQIFALIRTGLEARTAFSALLRGRDRLGATLGFADV